MQLDVAAYGWLDEGWDPAYPEDMPVEWRLDYYANEYRAIIVPRASWYEQEDVRLLEWIIDAHPAFEFYWELAGEEDALRLQSLYQRQADVSPAGGWLVLPGCSMNVTAEQELSELAPVAHCVDHGECSGAVTLVTVDEGVNLRQLREQLDELKVAEASLVLLVVKPSPGAAGLLEQLQTLCQLYGG